MFEKILVPLDGSELAEKALPYAEELAVKLGSEVTLVTIGTQAENVQHPENRVYLSKKAADMEQNFKKSSAAARAKKAKVTSDIVSSSGLVARPAEEIVEYADKKDINMIIMATHGRTGITRWVMGDTANKVASSFKCPLLLIRAKADVPQKIQLKKILVPLDGSKASETVLTFIEILASRLKPAINLLHIVEMQFHVYAYPEAAGYGAPGIVRVPYNKEEMKPFREAGEKYIKGISDKLKEKGIESTTEVRVGSPGDEIIEMEQEQHPDIVVMSTHGHSGFGRFDHGSITDKVLHGGKTPLLLVRPQKS